MIYKSDFLVIGGGVAGMTFALKVANSGKGKVILVCKTTLDEQTRPRHKAVLHQ